MGVVRAYPFIVKRRRALTHKHHFLLTLFSKNFKFLDHVGYATALACYFGYKLCVIRVDRLLRNKLFAFPPLGGAEFVQQWSIVGLVSRVFRVQWLRFMVYALQRQWIWYQRRAWKWGVVHTKELISTQAWRLMRHRFWKISSLGQFVCGAQRVYKL